MPEDLDQHTNKLRDERSDRMAAILYEAFKNCGVEALDTAHGEVCFHFDDGMTMQVNFHCGKKTEEHV